MILWGSKGYVSGYIWAKSQARKVGYQACKLNSNATRIAPRPVWRIGGLDGWKATGLEESGGSLERSAGDLEQSGGDLEGSGYDLEGFGRVRK